MKHPSSLALILWLSVFYLPYTCHADDFDGPYDCNPEYETVFIKHRVIKDKAAKEGWSIQGDTVYGHFDDANIAELPASEVGSITLDGSQGIKNVQIAVDLKKRYDFREYGKGEQLLRIGSVTNTGDALESVRTIIKIENDIGY